MVDVNLLYFCIREELNKTANRVMAVIDPVKLVIDNWEDGKVEMIEVENNPNDETAGKRQVPFGKELYIEADDFMEEPPKKYFRVCQLHHNKIKGFKMNDRNKSTAHTTWNCKYHIVFAPKFRRKILYSQKREVVGKILRKLCEWKDVEIIEAEVCPDHVHMLVAIPPKLSVSSFMGYLKSG